jgi:hypothetical protein
LVPLARGELLPSLKAPLGHFIGDDRVRLSQSTLVELFEYCSCSKEVMWFIVDESRSNVTHKSLPHVSRPDMVFPENCGDVWDVIDR